MASLAHPCAHCGKEGAAFTVHADLPMPLGKPTGYHEAAVFLICNICGHAAIAELRASRKESYVGGSIRNMSSDPLRAEWVLKSFSPMMSQPDVPEYLPEAVARNIRNAEMARHRKEFEPAAMSYGKALDLAFKTFPEAETGMLGARIRKLGQLGKIPAELAEWAQQLRIVRNDNVHDDVAPSEAEIADLAETTLLILRYLFTMPGRLAALKAQRGATAEA